MPDWLVSPFTPAPSAPLALLTWRVGLALILGLSVSGIYRWAKRSEVVSATFLTTLILLSVVIAMATQVIGDNIARAFSLVGALSVVRFRTVVKDTQDTAFVIFAVVVGMASGANQVVVALVGIGVLLAASPFLWPTRSGGGWANLESTLDLRVPIEGGAQEAAESILSQSLAQFQLRSASAARKGSCLDLKYRVRLKPGQSASALVVELTRIPGVESVELRGED